MANGYWKRRNGDAFIEFYFDLRQGRRVERSVNRKENYDCDIRRSVAIINTKDIGKGSYNSDIPREFRSYICHPTNPTFIPCKREDYEQQQMQHTSVETRFENALTMVILQEEMNSYGHIEKKNKCHITSGTDRDTLRRS
ncbi:hypothetical protein TNCV_4038731 [Trichonephila clavipes]|nr:hypothetical protein TNCV_4038731 [Trichonephila clavipes]